MRDIAIRLFEQGLNTDSTGENWKFD